MKIYLVGLLLYCSASWSQEVGFSPNDIHKLHSVTDVRISPNGLNILYVESDASGTGQPTLQLKLYERKYSRSRVFSKLFQSGYHARWSPDGSKVAFLGTHKGKFGLIVTDALGNKGEFLTEVSGTNHPLPSSGERLAWSPDSNSIAFLSSVPGPESEETSSDPVVIRRYLYKPTASEGMTRFNDNRRVHIFIVDLGTHEIRGLTSGDYYEHSLSFSPNGHDLLFVSNREFDPDRNFNYDIFVVDIRSNQIRRLTATENAEYRPVFSPDGTQIVYQGTTRGLTSSETTMEDTHIWIMKADGSQRRELIDLDNRQGPPQWAHDGKSVYFTVQEQGNVSLYQFAMDSGTTVPIFQDKGRVNSFSLSREGEIAHAFHGVDDLTQLYLNSTKLTSTNREILDRRVLAETVSFQFDSFDGISVEAFLTMPLKQEKGSKHPLVVSLKGGPHSQSGYQLNHKAQVYAAQGWAMLQVNYRGSTGYGQSFADAIFGDQNGGEAKDCIYATRAALKRYDFLDPNRLGIEGGSYGGQLTNWIVTQTNLFKAAIPRAGISNLISFNYMAYYHDYLAVEYGGYPHEDNLMDRLWQRSPLRYVARVSTPVLFLHGENDNDVPIAEAEQYYIALKDVGVDTVMVRYPREGHGIREIAHRVDVVERSVDWYEKYFSPFASIE